MKRKTLTKLLCTLACLLLFVGMSGTTLAAEADVEDIRVNWSCETRLMDMAGGNFWYTGTYSTGANGQLSMWRPTALEGEAMSDNAHFKMEVTMDMTKYPYFYVEVEENTPVEVSFTLTNTMGSYTALSAQKLEAGRVYKLRWEKDDAPGKPAKFMAGEMKYDLQVVAHFNGAFSDDVKVKIKRAYFGDETLTRAPTEGNEAIKLDFAGSMMDSATDLTINDDLSMLVQSEFNGTYCFHNTFFVDLEQTPYIYVDIQECYGGDVWYLDLNDFEGGTNCRPLGFIGIGPERQVYRIKIADYLARLKLDVNETEHEINISFIRTDEDEVNPITVNGIYLGDEYFNYDGIDTLTDTTPVDTEITPAFGKASISLVVWIIIGGGVALIVVVLLVILLAAKKKKSMIKGASANA